MLGNPINSQPQLGDDKSFVSKTPWYLSERTFVEHINKKRGEKKMMKMLKDERAFGTINFFTALTEWFFTWMGTILNILQ